MTDLTRDEWDDRQFPPQPMPLPAAGTRVRVTMHNRSIYPKAWKTARIIGTVIRRPDWTDPDDFAITTEFGTRVIKRCLLLSINGMRVDQAAPTTRLQTWQVLGSKGDTYRVTVDDDVWTCTCSGFTFRHKCRHIDEQRDKL